MLMVLMAVCSDTDINGLGAITGLLASTRCNRETFEKAFPSLNGDCGIYPRLVGLRRNTWEPTILYLLVEDPTERDCEAIKAIPGMMECKILYNRSPDDITPQWLQFHSFPHYSSQMLWAPEDGGGS